MDLQADNTEEIIGDKCKVLDPLTGHTYDLSSLQSSGLFYKSDRGQYRLGICGKPPSDITDKSRCPDNSGIYLKPSHPAGQVCSPKCFANSHIAKLPKS